MEEQKQEQLDKIKLLKQQYISVFSGKDGAKILADLESKCYIHKTPYVPRDPYGTHVNIGKQFVIQHIKNMMEFDIKKITELITESEE